jgi:hypothetical protein
MKNGKSMVEVSTANVLCNATVDLISRVQRPFLWKVTVTGVPPHATTRVYEISASSDNRAAMRGIDRFVRDMSRPMRIITSLLS